MTMGGLLFQPGSPKARISSYKNVSNHFQKDSAYQDKFTCFSMSLCQNHALFALIYEKSGSQYIFEKSLIKI